MTASFKIVSGGQTGVDRIALDVAMYLQIEHGGFCPLGRRSEDGPIPEQYQLVETEKRDYAVRTEKNVVHSDGTLILFCGKKSDGKLTGGTELTYRLTGKHSRPCLRVDLDEVDFDVEGFTVEVEEWIEERNISVLNVAGPRESSSPGITDMAEAFLLKALRHQPRMTRNIDLDLDLDLA